MEWLEILGTVGDFDEINVFQIVILIILAIITITKYSRSFFATAIELLLMEQKESQKKDISTAFLLFIIISIGNMILSYDMHFIVLEFIGCIIIFAVMGVIKLVGFITKKDFNEYMNYLELLLIIVAIPMLCGIVKISKELDLIIISLIGALVETTILILINNGFKPEKSRILIKNNKKSLYVYRKLNDEYILCGDSNKIEDASKVVSVKISDILEQKYYMVLDKEEEEMGRSK